MFDGDSVNSPNKIPYMFFPFNRMTYTDDGRQNIIQVNDHHTEGVMVVALTGLQELNTIVHLNKGIKTCIRFFFLAIPAQGTMTGKLFLQVEHQPTNDQLICCFHSADAAKVTLRLGGLESSYTENAFKSYTPPEINDQQQNLIMFPWLNKANRSLIPSTL